MKKIIYSFVLFFLINPINISNAQNTSEDNQEEENISSIFENFKSDLNIQGLGFEFGYTGDYFSNLLGGVEEGSAYLDNIDIVFNLNLQELAGWKGATLTIYFLGNHGGEPMEYSGAVQGISNIAAYDTWKLYELRLEQFLFDGNLSLLAGLYDLNSEFDTREFSGIFINPSHGIGTEFALTGYNGPSIFPYTSLAFRVSYNFTPSWNIKTAVFDGIPGDLNNPEGTKIVFDKEDGLLLTSEINYTNGSGEIDNNYFKYAVGGWYYTGEFESISGTGALGNPKFQKGNHGIYASAEKFLFSENIFTNEGLGAFVRYGISDKNLNPVDAYLGAGINYKGLIPGRNEDVFGLALAASHNNEKFREILAEQNIEMKDYEYIIEVTYNFGLSNYIQIQPDIQYVINPSAVYNADNSLVVGTRIQLAL